MPEATEWPNLTKTQGYTYVCGYCGKSVGPESGYHRDRLHEIYICPVCKSPTFFSYSDQVPGEPYGNDVGALPDDVNQLYSEARKCMTVSAYTAAVLTCRKILMHIAVGKGAPANQSFMTYVEYLSDNNYVPPGGKGWVDHIRQKGNEANHEILTMSKENAQDLISFVEMLLKVVFEFPAKIQQNQTTP